MPDLPFDTGAPLGHRATFGLIVLQTDETIEGEFREVLARDIALHVSRVPSGKQVTPETLAEMKDELPRAASLLPHAAEFDAIAYCCTSGATVIGPDVVARQVNSTARTRAVTDPLTATKAALAYLGIRRLAYISPYVADVTRPMRRALGDTGIEIVETASFNEADDATVARIDPSSTARAATKIGRRDDIDAVFLSCTNLQTFAVVDQIEAAISKPVVSSNLALAWHLSHLSGQPEVVRGPGLLLNRAAS